MFTHDATLIYSGFMDLSSKCSGHESSLGLDNVDIKYQMNFELMLI